MLTIEIVFQPHFWKMKLIFRTEIEIFCVVELSKAVWNITEFLWKHTDEINREIDLSNIIMLCVFDRKWINCQALSDPTRSASDTSECKAALSHSMIKLSDICLHKSSVFSLTSCHIHSCICPLCVILTFCFLKVGGKSHNYYVVSCHTVCVDVGMNGVGVSPVNFQDLIMADTLWGANRLL